MTALPGIYERFQDAVLDKKPGLALHDIRQTGSLTADERIEIYIDAYRLRLRQAIEADYPALFDYMGENNFNHLAYKFIECHPSTSFNLDSYAFGFYEHVEQYCSDSFAQDLARLEAAIAEVFIGEESEPLSPDMIDIEHFAETTLYPRLASRLLSLAHPAPVWIAAQREEKKLPRPPTEATHLFLYRHENEVQRKSLSPLAYDLLSALVTGKSVGEALEAVPKLSPSEVQSLFADWLRSGVFRAQGC